MKRYYHNLALKWLPYDNVRVRHLSAKFWRDWREAFGSTAARQLWKFHKGPTLKLLESSKHWNFGP